MSIELRDNTIILDGDIVVTSPSILWCTRTKQVLRVGNFEFCQKGYVLYESLCKEIGHPATYLLYVFPAGNIEKTFEQLTRILQSQSYAESFFEGKD